MNILNKIARILAVSFFLQTHIIAKNSSQIHSSKRFQNETLDEAISRYRKRLSSFQLQIQTNTVLDLKKPIDELDLSNVPQWKSARQLQVAFERIRDERFLFVNTMPDFPRRLSWLYPDDGCHARAQLSGINLKNWGYIWPAKIFVFGALRIRTENHPHGFVSWWYHVVPIVKLEEDYFVFDPALDYYQPLMLDQWLLKMTTSLDIIEASICDPQVYVPSDKCFSDTNNEILQSTIDDEVWFLKQEWERLLQLGRNPEIELGDYPPWVDKIKTSSGLWIRSN